MKELNNILKKLNKINEQMNREAYAWEMELKDRQKLGLTGDDAIKHYNEWMKKFKMDYLMV